jgi:hypothetical protein
MKLVREEAKIMVTGRSFYRKNKLKFKGRNRNQNRSRNQNCGKKIGNRIQNRIQNRNLGKMAQFCITVWDNGIVFTLQPETLP